MKRRLHRRVQLQMAVALAALTWQQGRQPRQGLRRWKRGQGLGVTAGEEGQEAAARSNASSSPLQRRCFQRPLHIRRLRRGPLLSELRIHSMQPEDVDLLTAISSGRKVREALSETVKEPRIAFLFLTPGSLPFAPLWERFLMVRLFASICLFIFAWIPLFPLHSPSSKKTCMYMYAYTVRLIIVLLFVIVVLSLTGKSMRLRCRVDAGARREVQRLCACVR